jgi:hypothetical protein
MTVDRTSFRPESELDARTLMLDCESKRDYEGATLAAITMADYVAVRERIEPNAVGAGRIAPI